MLTRTSATLAQSSRRIRALWLGLPLLACCLALLFGLVVYRPGPRDEFALRSGILLEQPRPLARVALVFEDGSPLDSAALRGRWTVIFPGYTHCPDACPTTLAQLRQAKALLSAGERRWLRIVFLSVDPERDVPERLGRYVRHFDPEFRAATGPLLQLESFAASIGVVFLKVGGPDEVYYSVDHSTRLALINPDGLLAGYLTPPFTPESIAVDLRTVLKGSAR